MAIDIVWNFWDGWFYSLEGTPVIHEDPEEFGKLSMKGS